MDHGKRPSARRQDDVLVIGAGPAGLAAAASLARYGRRVRILDSRPPGGRARELHWIENYPGFPEGVTGRRLMSGFARHARRWGAVLESVDATALTRGACGFRVETAAGPRNARAVVLALGRHFRPLGLKREDTLSGVGHGLLDRRAARGKAVCVVGGGETAVHQAIEAARVAAKVHLVARGPRLKAHGLLLRRLKEADNVRARLGWTPVGLEGKDRLEQVVFRRTGGSRRLRLRVDRLSILAGQVPRRLSSGGASGAGVFLAGDGRPSAYRQIAVAAADGIKAAMDCERFLNEHR